MDILVSHGTEVELQPYKYSITSNREYIYIVLKLVRKNHLNALINNSTYWTPYVVKNKQEYYTESEFLKL